MKRIWLVFVLLLIISMVAGCGGQSTKTKNETLKKLVEFPVLEPLERMPHESRVCSKRSGETTKEPVVFAALLA